MIDYLERLLERLQEDETIEQDVLRLDEESKPAPPPKRRTGGGKAQSSPAEPPRSGPAAPAAGSGQTMDAFPETTSAAPGSAPAMDAFLQTASAAAAARAGAVSYPLPPHTLPGGAADAPAARPPAGVSLVRTLDQVVDVLARTADPPPRTPGLPGSSPEWPASSPAPSAAGSAALARRLSDAALAAPPPASRPLFALDSDQLPPSADWDEFDRRLERDARRYDGGVHLF